MTCTFEKNFKTRYLYGDADCRKRLYYCKWSVPFQLHELIQFIASKPKERVLEQTGKEIKARFWEISNWRKHALPLLHRKLCETSESMFSAIFLLFQSWVALTNLYMRRMKSYFFCTLCKFINIIVNLCVRLPYTH